MGFHWPELIIITVVALLIFGPKRLPEIGGALGNTYKEFKKSVNDLAESTKTEAEK
jgi:sec-independent protein translocase protein TatA